MSDIIEKCYFLSDRKKNTCDLLINTKCTGTRLAQICSFRKTKSEFIAEQDYAIALNREKGNCDRCKYQKSPCRISCPDECVPVQLTAQIEEVENEES